MRWLALAAPALYPIPVNARKIPWIEIGILVVAVLFRVVLLDLKPAHFDEGVNGWFADQMSREGFFRYDPTNYHGPLHMYAVLLSQTFLGRNLWALRLPAIVASLLAVWALLRYREFFGPTTARIAALAMAISPACVFYGRYSIHESGMMFFQILFLWGLLGIWQKGERRYFRAAVAAAVGMILTKETYVLHLGSFLLAGGVLWLWQKVLPSRPDVALAPVRWTTKDAVWAGSLSLLTIVFFYSGNFLDFSILHGLYQTFGAWFHTGVEAGGHEKDTFALFGIKQLNYYWIMLLAVYEWPALLGLVAGLRYIAPSDARLRYIAIYGGGVLLAYSLIPYKTPWCILCILWPFLLLFGAAVDEAAKLLGPRVRRPAWVLAIGTVTVPFAMSIVTSLRLNFFDYDNAREPYVYVQTSRQVERLLGPILGKAQADARFYHVTGSMFLDSYYPLPWVFGDFPRLAYFNPGEQTAGIESDFVVAPQTDEDAVAACLQGRYFKRTFTLRDAQSDCVVYFRESTYGEFFPGEEPATYHPAVVDPSVLPEVP